MFFRGVPNSLKVWFVCVFCEGKKAKKKRKRRTGLWEKKKKNHMEAEGGPANLASSVILEVGDEVLLSGRFDQLSDEIMENIWKFLTPKDISKAALVCKR